MLHPNLRRAVLAYLCAVGTAASATANLLVNPGFEVGLDMPASWNTWGDGDFVWQSGGARGGDRCMNLGGDDFALMYQRVTGTPHERYRVRAWAKRVTGNGGATLKLEFHDAAENVLDQYVLQFTAPADWTRYTVAHLAPVNTALVTATIVGEAGGTVLFDDVSLIVDLLTPDVIEFDLANRRQTFNGFGTMIWGYGPTAEYPDLLTIRRRALRELNIKYVRIENVAESASWTDLQITRSMTNALGIQWVYLAWTAPPELKDEYGRLRDDKIADFGAWWAARVDELYNHGIYAEYVELMNEPDSGGGWSTGIAATQYNEVVKQVRAALDTYDGTGGTNDLTGVGIVGPGLAVMTDSGPYIDGLDEDGVAAMGAWSTHAWGSVDACGSACEEIAWPYFGDPANAQNPNLLKFVTEFGSHQTTFGGVTYPHADMYGEWDLSAVFPYFSVTNCMPYAVRVFGNSLALLNSGANVPFVWQAIDEPSEVGPPTLSTTKRKSWGLLDLWGNPKPVYDALHTLWPRIPVGAEIVASPDQSSNLVYSGALVDGDHVVIGIANGEDLVAGATIRITNAPEGLAIREAIAFEQVYWGDAAIGEPDIGQTVARDYTLTDEGGGVYSVQVTLPPISTLTLDLDVVDHPPGDIDGNCVVDLTDLGLLLADYNCTEGDCIGDLDANGTTDLTDLGTLLAAYGDSCP